MAGRERNPWERARPLVLAAEVRLLPRGVARVPRLVGRGAARRRRHYNPRHMDKEEIRRRLALSCPPGELERWGAAPPGGGAAPLMPAAVLVALVASPQGPEIILTQRTAEMRNHPAQISLPGGRIEPEDGSPAQAALREAW